MTLISVSEPPHIRKVESVKSLAVKTFLAALLPLTARLCLTPLSASLQILGISGGVFAACFLQSRISSGVKTDNLWLTVSLASVLAALLPLSSSVFTGFIAGGLLVLFGTFFPGKYASLLFHPAVLACALISKIFPQDFSADPDLTRGLILSSAAAGGGILLCAARVISWKIPAVFLSVLAFGFFAGMNPSDFLNEGRLCMIGFFALTDPVTTPLRLSARLSFSFLAAALTLIMAPALTFGPAALFSLLIMNAASAWFDMGKIK